MRRLHVWRTYSINTTPIAYLCPRVPLSRTHPSPCRLRRGGKEGKLDRLVAPGASRRRHRLLLRARTYIALFAHWSFSRRGLNLNVASMVTVSLAVKVDAAHMKLKRSARSFGTAITLVGSPARCEEGWGSIRVSHG